MKKILVTGAAGFVGFHTFKKLAYEGYDVVGFDNINDYYDVQLKYARLEQLGFVQDQIQNGVLVRSEKYQNIAFLKADLMDKEAIFKLFEQEKFDGVVNLAAQAGVRHSLQFPQDYIDTNVTGFLNILEACRNYPVQHLVYASTSSVYGLNKNTPFSEDHDTAHPMSLYAASKKANELMAHSYSHLYNIPCTGLRFFSVYGPWGRPDMALFIFTRNILAEKSIDVYNNGDMKRNFTYVDDIVNGVYNVLINPPKENPNWDAMNPVISTSSAAYRVLNIGNKTTVNLSDFIEEIENNVGKKAIKNFLPMQAGDVAQNIADIHVLENEYGYSPKTSVKEGVKAFVDWYMNFYHNN